MPRFDPDLIAALAEGRLDPAEAERVERELASDPGAVEALAAQRAALTALREAPPIHLSEVERAALRASIADAIGISAPAAASAVPRRVPWSSIGIAAAALVGLVAVVPVVGLLNTSGDDATADTRIAAEAPTTEAADTASDADTPGTVDMETLGADDGSFDPAVEAPGEGAQGFVTSTTGVARATTTVVPEDTAPADETTTTTSPDLEALVSELMTFKEDLDAIEEIATEAIEGDPCWLQDAEERGGPEELGPRWIFEYPDGEAALVVYFQYDEEGTPGAFSVYEPFECAHLAEVE